MSSERDVFGSGNTSWPRLISSTRPSGWTNSARNAAFIESTSQSLSAVTLNLPFTTVSPIGSVTCSGSWRSMSVCCTFTRDRP